MRNDYRSWLEAQQYDSGTITAQLHRTGRVEDCYGNLEEHIANGTFYNVIEELTYSAEDERRGKPNPSKIPFQGNIRNNLTSYKSATMRYKSFLTSSHVPFQSPMEADGFMPAEDTGSPADSEPAKQKLSLERDMQKALRHDIKNLLKSLTIIDDGAERSVDSGFIDITCRDETDNAIVILELKADKADSRAIGQILGYMGDIAVEENEHQVRGILIAHDFDKRAKAAARVVPSLKLMKYSVAFKFEPID